MNTERLERIKVVFAGRRVVSGGKLVQLWHRLDEARDDDPQRILIDLTRGPAVGQVYMASTPGGNQWFTGGEHAAEYLERWDTDDPLVVEWTILDGAAVAEHGARARQKKEGRTNALTEALEPVREAYRKAPANTKRAILAEVKVMRILTS